MRVLVAGAGLPVYVCVLAEQRDLCFGGRPSMQRSWRRFEEPDLRRAGRRCGSANSLSMLS
jgi:hypothetical protein